MNLASTTKQILEIRTRLEEIEAERRDLPVDAFAERADLMDEEHELTARLAELRSSVAAVADDEVTEELPVDAMRAKVAES